MMFDNELDAEAVFLIWPFRNGIVRDCLTIRNFDARYCIPENLTNDLMVDFSILEYRSNLPTSDVSLIKVHVFSVLLHTKLTDPENNDRDWFGKFRSVNSWARKVDFKEKEYLVFPIHGKNHYYLITYVHLFSALSGAWSKDTDDENIPYPCILVFDSLKKSIGKYNEVFENLNHYVIFEYMIQSFSMIDWCCGLVSMDVLLKRIKCIDIILVACPQQPADSVNCGMYSTKNVKFIHESIPKINKRMSSDLQNKGFAQLYYNDNDVSTARLQLSDRIKELRIEYEEFLKNQKGAEEFVLSDVLSTIGSGGQLRGRVRKETSSTTKAFVDLVSEDEYSDCNSEKKLICTQLDCVVEELSKPLPPTILQTLVAKKDVEVPKTSNKKKKRKRVEIDIDSIEIDTSEAAF